MFCAHLPITKTNASNFLIAFQIFYLSFKPGSRDIQYEAYSNHFFIIAHNFDG